MSEDKNLPTKIDEAARLVLAELKAGPDFDFFKSTDEKHLVQFHHTLGRQIRNRFRLWGGNKDLLASCGHGHPDEASFAIIRRAWQLAKMEKQKT